MSSDPFPDREQVRVNFACSVVAAVLFFFGAIVCAYLLTVLPEPLAKASAGLGLIAAGFFLKATVAEAWKWGREL